MIEQLLITHIKAQQCLQCKMTEVCCMSAAQPERPWKIHCNTVDCFPGVHGHFPTQNKGLVTSLMTLPPLDFPLSLSYWMEIYSFPGTPHLPAFPASKIQYRWDVHSPQGSFSSYILIHRSQSQRKAVTICCNKQTAFFYSCNQVLCSRLYHLS